MGGAAPESAAGSFGRRDRRGGVEGQADPFVDLLEAGGEGAW